MRHLATPGSSHPGVMTAVMRAAAAHGGAGAVRVARVREGKITEERVVRRGGRVTVGSTETNDFVVTGADVPDRLVLLEQDTASGCFRLNVRAGMSGKVSSGGAIVALGRDGPILLGEDARGRIEVCGATFLFQALADDPSPARAPLPLSLRRAWAADVDWMTTILVAFSFLLHFGVVGAAYSDWMDPVLDEEVRVSQLVESVAALPAPLVETEPTPTPRENEAMRAPTPTAATAAARAPAPARGREGGGAPGALSDARASDLSDELAALDLEMLAVLRRGGSATAAVLRDGDVPTDLLDSAAASSRGARADDGAGLNLLGDGARVVRPGATRGSLLGDLGRGDRPVDAGAAEVTPGPRGSVGVSPPATTGTVPGAEGVVASMAAGFRRCYQNGLDREDPSMSGSVRIIAKIGPNGEVLSASPAGGAGLSASVIGCMVSRVASAQFAEPIGGGATLVIPVTVRVQ